MKNVLSTTNKICVLWGEVCAVLAMFIRTRLPGLLKLSYNRDVFVIFCLLFYFRIYGSIF
jgi:hypothetical protein